jgi:selenocysteine lyase/cysteine desulfurase
VGERASLLVDHRHLFAACSSKLSAKCAAEARRAVLSFFQAGPDYTVIFTANASSALKLVGEAYPFKEGSNLVIGVDSHNSVHGLRQFASHKGAEVVYIETTKVGGLDEIAAKVGLPILFANLPSLILYRQPYCDIDPTP